MLMLPGLSVKPVSLFETAVSQAYKPFHEDFTIWCFDPMDEITNDCCIEKMAEDLKEALNIIGITQADIFGCSLGGMIAQEIAIRYPAFPRKMILSSTISRFPQKGNECVDEWLYYAERGDAERLNRVILERIYSANVFQTFGDHFFSKDSWGTPEELRLLAIRTRAIKKLNAYDRLDQVLCPTFVLGSWDDKVFSHQSLIETAEKLNCPLYMYAGFGHAIYDEAPDFKERMLAFLRG